MRTNMTDPSLPAALLHARRVAERAEELGCDPHTLQCVIYGELLSQGLDAETCLCAGGDLFCELMDERMATLSLGTRI
jgi:hypothetical protein